MSKEDNEKNIYNIYVLLNCTYHHPTITTSHSRSIIDGRDGYQVVFIPPLLYNG